MTEYQVLARKWRPTKFSDVKGQDHVVRTLKNSILNNRVASAYLFSGSRGVGKTSVARLLAKAVCCHDLQDGEPCNKCSSCVEITNSSSMDIQEIDGASNNGVDNIREIRDNIMYPPVSSKYKIYIIDEVHMLSTSAFNALLKTLEEPPSHGIFIFATTEPHKVPSTIVSRCQFFDFKRLSVENIVATLESIAQKENITAPKQAMSSIAREARGSLRDSLSILDQVISFAGNNFSADDVKNILGLVDRNIIFAIARAVTENNHKECITFARRLFNEAYDVKKITDTLVEVFRELMFVKNGLGDMLAEELPDYEIKETKDIASKTTAADVEQWFYMANNTAEEIKFSPYPWILFEASLITMCNKPQNTSIDELVKRLNSAPNLSSPSDQPLIEKKNTVAPPQQKKAYKDLNWDELLSAVGKADSDAADILSKGKFLGIEQERNFVVDYSEAVEFINKFTDKTLQLIQDTIYELYGTIYKIDIRSNILMQRMSDNEKRRKGLLDKDVVKSAVEILNAKVKEVKLY